MGVMNECTAIQRQELRNNDFSNAKNVYSREKNFESKFKKQKKTRKQRIKEQKRFER